MRVSIIGPTEGGVGPAACISDLIPAMREFVTLEVVPIAELQTGTDHRSRWLRSLNESQVVHFQHDPREVDPDEFWRLRYEISPPFVVTAHDTRPTAAAGAAPRGVAGVLERLLPGRRRARVDAAQTAPFATGRVIVHSRQEADTLAQRGIHPPFITVVAPGCPALAVPHAADPPDAVPTAIILGDPTEDSGHEIALQALAQVPDLRLRLALSPRAAADRAAVTRLGALAATLKLADRMDQVIVATPEDRGRAYSTAELAICPSARPGCSYAVLMALGAGVPVAAADTEWAIELHAHDACFRMFRQGDADHLAAALRGLLRNPEGRSEMRRRSQILTARRTWHTTARETVEVYRAAIADVTAFPRMLHQAARRAERTGR